MGLTPSERKEFAMAQATTVHSARASLCALGEYLRRHAFFAPLYHHLQIPQKTITYRPVEKLLDALVGMLCGAKTSAQSTVTVRGDPAATGLWAQGRCGPIHPCPYLTGWHAPDRAATGGGLVVLPQAVGAHTTPPLSGAVIGGGY
jgi:hypothetical protein